MKYLQKFLESEDALLLIKRMLSEIDELRYILQDDGFDITLNANKITQLVNQKRTVIYFNGDDTWSRSQSDFLLEFMDRIGEVCEKYGFEVESEPSKMEIGITDTQRLEMLCFQIKHRDIQDDDFNSKFYYPIHHPR